MLTLKKKPLIIAGPCSAETEDQLRKITSFLQTHNADIIRAGIWKPRTRPGSFDGVGTKGLKWIKEIKKDTGSLFAIEVATPHHVELAMNANIDVLWLGSRSTTNPFTVQAIADTLRGVDIPIMVKNPINPDIGLWIGAIERLRYSGITQIAAIHRGFSTNEITKYRNMPIWQIPIDLKSKFPDIPIICDPSHMSGNRKYILELTQKAFNLDYDGLMVEVHSDPDNALSDPAQQISPVEFIKLLSEIQIRHSKTDDISFNEQMESLREKIDQIDRQIVAAVEKRINLVIKAGLEKTKYNVTAFQLERWQDILQTRPQWVTMDQINPEFILNIFKIIHNESLSIQLEIMDKHNRKK